jgi:ATP-dependent protease Clp ATPase subunit
VATPDKVQCITCRLSQSEVKRLVAIPAEVGNIYICDECVGVLVGIMAEDNSDWRDQQIKRLKDQNSN